MAELSVIANAAAGFSILFSRRVITICKIKIKKRSSSDELEFYLSTDCTVYTKQKLRNRTASRKEPGKPNNNFSCCLRRAKHKENRVVCLKGTGSIQYGEREWHSRLQAGFTGGMKISGEKPASTRAQHSFQSANLLNKMICYANIL